MSDRLIIETDAEAWAERCAILLAETLAEAAAAEGRAVLAVAGGTTPAPVFRRLSGLAAPWERVTVTLTDERRVPPDHPASNERLVRETLLTDLAAVAAFARLRPGALERAPDAVLLGMGEDGHVASIFPGDPQMGALLDPAAAPACVAVPAGDGVPPPQPRLTLNLAALAAAGRVVLAIRGDTKRRLHQRAATGEAPDLPIARLLVSGADLVTVWSQ